MLRSADRHYALSSAIALRGLREARKRRRDATAAALIVARHQAALAQQAEVDVAAMLAEQGTPVAAQARINPLAFTTAASSFARMVEVVEAGWQYDRLVLSLIQDAGRGAESVSIAARPQVGYVRYVSPPSCSRCAILAGRFYRYSDGFLRHPGCDCTHLPTTDPRTEYRQNPQELVEQGLVTGLSKADRKALADGADLNKVVNARRSAGDLREAGEVLSRAGRPTPAGIYRMAGADRDKALGLLEQYGYLR